MGIIGKSTALEKCSKNTIHLVGTDSITKNIENCILS